MVAEQSQASEHPAPELILPAAVLATLNNLPSVGQGQVPRRAPVLVALSAITGNFQGLFACFWLGTALMFTGAVAATGFVPWTDHVSTLPWLVLLLAIGAGILIARRAIAHGRSVCQLLQCGRLTNALVIELRGESSPMSREFSEPPDKDLWSLQRGATYFVTFIYRDEAGAVRQREYNTAHPELLRANRRQLLLHSTGSVDAFELACFIPGGARIDEQGNVRAGWFRTLWCLIPLVYLLLMPLWLPLLILSGKFDLG